MPGNSGQKLEKLGDRETGKLETRKLKLKLKLKLRN